MALLTADQIENMIECTGGVTVVFSGGEETSGSFDDPNELVLETPAGSGIRAAGPSVLVATGKVPDGTAIDDPITVDGTSYTIRDMPKENDGAETRIFLRE